MQWIVKGYPYCLKVTSPANTDTGYPLNFVWVNISSGIAYILDSLTNGVASWIVKAPDSVINGDINVIGETATGDLIVRTPGTVTTDGIVSEPGDGEHKITNLRVDKNHKLVATYDEA